MTSGEPVTYDVTGDSLQQLAELLLELPPDTRRVEAAHLFQVLAGRMRSRRATVANGDSPPLVIASWATDEGISGDRQQLGVGLAPQPVPMPKTAAATGRSVLSNGRLGADLIHLPAGEGFLPHTHPGDHLLFVLAGEGTIISGGVIKATSPGQAYLVEGAQIHAVGAVTEHVILAVGAPHRSIDDPDRQTLVEYDAVCADAGTVTCELCEATALSLQALSALGCEHVPRECR